MKRFGAYVALVPILAAGCASKEGLPLIFGQSQTVGVTIAGSAPEQGGEFTFGYRDKNVAIVPVAPQAKAPTDEGHVHSDALSVLGQFNVNTKTQPANVTLGKFFATGLAAKTLADGFRCQVGKGAPPVGCQRAENEDQGEDDDK